MVKRSEYELVFIAHPQLDGEEGVPALTAQVQAWIEGIDGEITHVDIWGRRRLAYPIRKQKEGTYVLLRAIMPRQALGELERQLKLSEDVIRYLLVRAETPLPPARTASAKPAPAARPAVETQESEAEEAKDEEEAEPVEEAETEIEAEPESEAEPKSEEEHEEGD
jgi:small subunit ribosomal protein S6